MLAQPIKDYFIHLIFFKPLYPETQNSTIKDRRIKDLSQKSQINRLLKVLVKELNLNRLSIITREKPIKQYDFLKDSETKVPNISLGEFETISDYYEKILQKDVTYEIPEEVEEIKQKNDWKTIIPITFKSNYFGFLAIQNTPDSKKQILLEGLAARIGLILENDLLSELALKNQTFKKEFTTARQVEKFLIEKKVVQTGAYKVFFKKNTESISDLPILFESSLQDEAENIKYFIYCRISKSNKRMRTMMLFIISGYFLSHSQKAKNLKELHRLLSQSIYRNGQEFGIEGFLIEHSTLNSWKICYFGAENYIGYDNTEIKLKKLVPLGKNESEGFESIDLKNKKLIVLKANPLTEINIIKDEK